MKDDAGARVARAPRPTPHPASGTPERTAGRRPPRAAEAEGLRSARLPVDDSIFFRLVRIVNLTARPFVESIGRSHRLSLNEWRVLLVLANHPGVVAGDVAALTGLDKMSVSRALAGLVREGRVLRRIDAADRRRVLLRLSAQGERLYERIGAPAKARERSLLRGIDAAEQQRLQDTLDRLIANLASADAAGATDAAATGRGRRGEKG